MTMNRDTWINRNNKQTL